jgi:hypothetical protein
MRVTYTTPNGRLRFELEVSTGEQAFEVVAGIAELFEEPGCGLCDSKRIRHEVREFDGNHYYKLLCTDCGATVDFGQHKDGKGLFLKRRNKDNQPHPNRGWYRYRKDEHNGA